VVRWKRRAGVQCRLGGIGSIGLFFCILLRDIIHAASSSHPHISLWWELGLFLAGTAVTVIYYLRRIFAVANETRMENPGTT
jgi:hypothetical protein